MTSVDDPLLQRPSDPPTRGPAPDAPARASSKPSKSSRASGSGGSARGSKSAAQRLGQKWSRLAHVYTSMIAFVVILLFAFTGLMLNHPTWTLGDDPNTSVETGELPVELFRADGALDFLTLSEFARNELGARGEVKSFGEVAGEASIVYSGPGYTADLIVDVSASTFEFTAEQQGWVAVLSNFHTGNETGGAWSLIIDAAAIFLLVVAISGIVLQFFLKKRRRSAYVSAGVGGIAVVAVIAAVLI